MRLNRILSRISYAFNTFVLGKELPYLLIVVLTDKCNLNCFYCESKNSGKYHLSFNQAVKTIKSGYDRGHRSIVQKYGFTGDERIELLDRIWAIKKKGYSIVFSKAAYKAMRTNNWKRPIKQIELATRDNLYTCCRDVGNPDVCENCGYSSCVEVSQILSLKPTAIWEIFRMAG